MSISKQSSVQEADDFSLSRVPTDKRYPWLTVTVMRFGQMSAMSQFLLGATLGYGMTFWHAVAALTLGAVILELIAIFAGYIGMKEGLQTSLLARWTGFGKYGSALLGLVIGISSIGWFGIQNGVFASGLQSLIGGLPLWAWSILSGVFVIAVVYFGVASMGWTAYVTVPLFLIVCFFSIGRALTGHPLGGLVASAAPGPHISIAVGSSLVAGSFIVGGVISPDMTRFNRSLADVVKQTVIGITLGEYTVGVIGVLLAHAMKTANIVNIVLSTSGVVGTVILITATLKINDWNLYDSTLGLVNALEVFTNRKFNRKHMTLYVGAVGVILSALGILNHFVGFLDILGVFVPPVFSIMIVEYFLLRRFREQLDTSRVRGALPSSAESWNIVCLVAWVIGALSAEFIKWGISSINSLVIAAIAYYVLGLIFLNRSRGAEATTGVSREGV
ncbi:MAG: cytosine permease [Alicyclobacillus sp.]|nr:cytosine permease [Alicyclobacillus sp.]